MSSSNRETCAPAEQKENIKKYRGPVNFQQAPGHLNLNNLSRTLDSTPVKASSSKRPYDGAPRVVHNSNQAKTLPRITIFAFAMHILLCRFCDAYLERILLNSKDEKLFEGHLVKISH